MLAELSVERRAGADQRPAAATGLGPGQNGRFRAGAQHHQEAARKAGGRRWQPRLHLQRASRRLSDAGGGDAGEGGDAIGGDVVDYIRESSLPGSSHERARGIHRTPSGVLSKCE